MKSIKKIMRGMADVLGMPVTFLTGLWNLVITRSNERTMPLSYALLRRMGVLPVRDHYYQPLINPQKHLAKPLEAERYLPGLNMNTENQLALLQHFRYAGELQAFPLNKPAELGYYYNNIRYESGDSEMLYNMIRHFKPKRIIEIGSGMSTLMAVNAIKKNTAEIAGYTCAHRCIEPYEMPWLESIGVEVIRKKVEDIALDYFNVLEANDILFIDSSHMIRPQGDVLVEYLEILPRLNKGVLVHVHDIFTPRDYPREWVYDEHRLWNEQYLLEAYLGDNSKYEVLAAVNYLKNNHFEALAAACPVLGTQPKRQPGAFWLRSLR